MTMRVMPSSILVFVLLGIVLSCLHAKAQPAATINGFPLVADTVTHTVYVPIEDPMEDSLAVTLASPHLASFRWDGSPVSESGIIGVDDWHAVHELSDSCEYGWEVWKVVFTSLPLVCLDFDHPEMMGDADTPCRMHILSPSIPTEGSSIFESMALARYRGGSSRYYAKKNFLVTLTDSVGKEQDTNVMGIREDSKWILNAMGADLSRLRNQLCFDIWNEVSALRPGDDWMISNGIKGYFVEVILNGRYAGVYQLSDKVNRSMLGLRKSAQDRLRGFLYKCEGNSSPTSRMILPDDYLEIYNPASDSFYDWVMKYPDFYNDESWQPLLDLLQFTSKAETNPQWAEQELDKWMYRDNVADYVLFVMALMLKDNCMHNVYLSLIDKENEHRFWITPWDLDASFGRSGWAFQTNYSSNPQEILSGMLYHLYELEGGRLMSDIIERWEVLKQTVYHPLSVAQRIHDYARLLQSSGAWQREVEAWQDSIVVPSGEVLHLADSVWDEAYYKALWYQMNYTHLDEMLMLKADVKRVIFKEKEEEVGLSLYDMMGRKLNTSTSAPGLYIMGGKKRVVRQ